MSRQNCLKKDGFTLKELLVVIAIFLLMIMALAPFMKMARLRANRINCTDNLRQISLGLHAYAADHNDAFPPDLAALYPNYVESQSVFNCPGSKEIGTPAIPDYGYTAGLAENSGPKEAIVKDLEHNHGKFGMNVLKVDGSIEWVARRR